MAERPLPTPEDDFVESFDRAAEQGHDLRRRQGLSAGETRSGAEVQERLRELDAAEPGDVSLSALAAAAKAGDERAREQLVEGLLPVVGRMARRYAGRDVDASDLVQEGVVGVLRALARFEPDRGAFPVYARWWVRQAMQQAIAEQSRAVRLPTHVLWELHDLREARSRLHQKRGGAVSDADVGRELGWSDARLRDALTAEAPALSLDAPHAADAGQVTTAGDLLEDPLSGDAFDRVLVETTGHRIRALLSTLTERERQVLGWRFGLDGEELSLRQIARRLGVSAERVRQIEERALIKLRTAALPGP
jgi:RNA polymerase primary sigma factor